MIPSSTQIFTHPDFKYSNKTLKRAERALCCSLFNLSLFVAMRTNSVPLSKIAQFTGVQEGYTQRSLSEQKTERDLVWLITVGVLRREVDGQGITDSFRLTPLGIKIINKWENQEERVSNPSWQDRVMDNFTRWFQLILS